jgi:hypothetical protein
MQFEMQHVSVDAAADASKTEIASHLFIKAAIVPAKTAEGIPWHLMGAVPFLHLDSVGLTGDRATTIFELELPAEVSAKIKGLEEDSPAAAILFGVSCLSGVKDDQIVRATFIIDVLDKAQALGMETVEGEGVA